MRHLKDALNPSSCQKPNRKDHPFKPIKNPAGRNLATLPSDGILYNDISGISLSQATQMLT